MDFIQTSVFHDNTHELLRKKFHYKSYHHDIKYHMTLTRTLHVVLMCKFVKLNPKYEKFPRYKILEKQSMKVI